MRITDFNLLNETTDLFRNAIALLEYRHRLTIIKGEVPSGYGVDSQEYKNGILYAKYSIMNNKFVNSESQDIVREAIVAYRAILPGEHKMTAKRIERFLEFIDAPRTCELSETQS